MTDIAWKACIGGDESFLTDLSRVLTGPDYIVRKGTDGFVVEGTMFARCKSEDDCRSLMSPWIESLNGAATLVGGCSRPVELSYVFFVAPDGTRRVFVLMQETIGVATDSVRVTVTKADGTIEEHFPAQEVPKILAAGMADQDVAKVLRLLAKRDRSWVQLYRVFEIVRGNVGGGDAVVRAGWISKAAQTRFTRSANHPEVSGDDARHGVDSSEPPGHPMTLAEARALIEAIVQQWLAR